VYYQIMHVIIILHKTSNVKVDLNTKLILLGSNLFFTSFMILPKFFHFCIQLNIIKWRAMFFHIFTFISFKPTFSCIYQKFCRFQIVFWAQHFFSLLYHAFTLFLVELCGFCWIEYSLLEDAPKTFDFFKMSYW
jgi:hypothetical protein